MARTAKEKDDASQIIQMFSIGNVTQAICDVEASCAGRPSFLDGVCDDGLRNAGRGNVICFCADSVLSGEDRESSRRWDSWRNG
jgi:hypothetical protein